jgi:hypothetical protein
MPRGDAVGDTPQIGLVLPHEPSQSVFSRGVGQRRRERSM